MAGRLKIMIGNPDKCIGCGLCELACSQIKNGNFNPAQARLRLVSSGDRYAAYSCMLCVRPKCIESCPRQALSQGENGIIQVNSELCDGCEKCVTACVFGAMVPLFDRRKVVVCDQCEGLDEPQCKKICPTEALQMVNPTPIKKQKAKDRINISVVCDSCGECARQCPSRALVMEEGWLTVDNPKLCMVCELCSTLCPSSAIRINRRVIFAD